MNSPFKVNNMIITDRARKPSESRFPCPVMLIYDDGCSDIGDVSPGNLNKRGTLLCGISIVALCKLSALCHIGNIHGNYALYVCQFVINVENYRNGEIDYIRKGNRSDPYPISCTVQTQR
jgi:hypothetical protein